MPIEIHSHRQKICNTCEHKECPQQFCPCMNRYIHLVSLRLSKRRCCHCQKSLLGTQKGTVYTTIAMYPCRQTRQWRKEHVGILGYCSVSCQVTHVDILGALVPLDFGVRKTAQWGKLNSLTLTQQIHTEQPLGFEELARVFFCEMNA